MRFKNKQKDTVAFNMCLQYFRHRQNVFYVSFPLAFVHVCDVGTVIIFIFQVEKFQGKELSNVSKRQALSLGPFDSQTHSFYPIRNTDVARASNGEEHWNGLQET